MKLKKALLILILLFVGVYVEAQIFQDSPGNENDGNFPSKWDLIKGSAQITSFEGSQVIQISNKGIIAPLLNIDNYLADSFTLEFDAYFDAVRKAITYQYYPIRFWSGNGALSLSATGGHYKPFQIYRHGVRVSGRSDKKTGFKHENLLKNLESKEALWRHVKVDYSNNNLKIYIDNTLVLNLPRLEFKPSMISIGAIANQYDVEFVRVIKNIYLDGISGTASTNGNSNNTSESTNQQEDTTTNDEDSTTENTEEVISAISVGEGGLSSVLNSDSSEPVNSAISSTVIDDIVYEEMIRQNLPGMAIGVYKKGVIDYTKGYGHLDLNGTVPITANTILRWASISKTITAVAALRLAEQSNSFSINDRVTKHYSHWISKFDDNEISDKANKNNISIRNLLNNRSGIRHYAAGVWANRGKYNPDNDNFNANSAVDIFRKYDLAFVPDTDFRYTTQGFNLLGAIIDKVYFDGYPKYVKKQIKDKLGMSSLKISIDTTYKGFRKKLDGIITESSIGSKEWVLPGGGWESNVQDLLKFAKGILDESLLINTDGLWEDELNEVENSAGEMVPQDYKRGINSMGSDMNLRVWHGGAHANLRTLMYIMPKRKIAVVVMIPAEYADTWNIVRKVVDKMGIDRSSSIIKGSKDKCVEDIMGGSSRQFVGLWRKTGDEIIIRRGYTSTNFNKEWKFLSSKGYYLEDIETFTSNEGKLLWEGIFKRGSGQYAMWRNADFGGFKNKWDELRQKGYILYDLETYKVNGQQRWTGLFKKQPGSNGLWRNFSTADFADKREEMMQQGKQLIDIEVYVSGGELKWSGIWIPGSAELLNRNYNYSDFLILIRDRKDNGYKLIDIETYKVNGIRKWAGIWTKDYRQQRYSLIYNYCKTMDRHDNFSRLGFELIDLENYED